MVALLPKWALWTLCMALCLLVWPGQAARIPNSGNAPDDSEKTTSPKQEQTARPLPQIVYRGDSRSPEELKKAGGVSPHKDIRSGFANQTRLTFSNESFDIYRHKEGYNADAYGSMYKSTTSNFTVAVGFGTRGWVYKIHASPNMIDLDASVKQDPYSEQEFSGLGGILYDQIIGWTRISQLEEDEASSIPYADKDLYRKWYTLDKVTWTENVDYNHKYDSLSPSPGQPQLVDVPEGKRRGDNNPYNQTLEQRAVDFMNKNGQAVGWDGKFTLLHWREVEERKKSAPPLDEVMADAKPAPQPTRESQNGQSRMPSL